VRRNDLVAGILGRLSAAGQQATAAALRAFAEAAGDALGEQRVPGVRDSACRRAGTAHRDQMKGHA
jgi:hypothetical protein